MKLEKKVMCACFVLLLAGCVETPTPRYYGTGTYRCFVQNMNSGRLLEGVSDTQGVSQRNSEAMCIVDTQGYFGGSDCVPIDCVFK